MSGNFRVAKILLSFNFAFVLRETGLLMVAANIIADGTALYRECITTMNTIMTSVTTITITRSMYAMRHVLLKS